MINSPALLENTNVNLGGKLAIYMEDKCERQRPCGMRAIDHRESEEASTPFDCIGCRPESSNVFTCSEANKSISDAFLVLAFLLIASS